MQSRSILISISAGIVIGLLLSNQCNPVQTKYKTVTDTIWGDTVTHTVTIEKPPVRRTDTVYIENIRIDTVRILQDYFVQREYGDTVRNDTSMFVAYQARVFNNELQSISFDLANRRPTIINHNYPLQDNSIMLGLNANLNTINLELSYRHKRNALSIQYGREGVGFGYRYEINGW